MGSERRRSSALSVRDDDTPLVLRECARDAGGRRRVDDHPCDMRHRSDPHGRSALELAVVCEHVYGLARFHHQVPLLGGEPRVVGEFAIGTNLACTHIIGHILQDEKLPGIHIAFGHPYCEHTGQTWKSTTHIDCVGRHFDIWLDDEQVMAKGKFLI